MTPDMKELPAELGALALRCEQAAGPDREIDAAIAEAAKAVPYDMDPAFSLGAWRGKYDNRYWDAPAYTASLDAAMSLVPEAWRYSISQHISPQPHVRAQLQCWHDVESARASTPALALCAAALRVHLQAHPIPDLDSKGVGRG